MISKHLKSFLIHLWKNKLYSVITILGFSISLTFILLLSIYIKNEYGVDEFHEKKERIFRLTHGEEAGFAPPSGPLLMANFPEIENFVRTRRQQGMLHTNETKKYNADLLYTDSTFFTVFSFQLINGSPKKVLERKNSIVLSESFAYKLFGKLPELGTSIKMGTKHTFELTGIMKDFPDNTHFKKYDALISFPSLGEVWGDPKYLEQYGNNSFGLYVLVEPNTNIQAKEAKMLELFKDVNWMFERGYAKVVNTEPITKSYFSNSTSYQVKQKSERFIHILLAIVFLILILSIINYVNLTIAQSSFRSKEIAIKKLIGSKKPALLAQSLLESIILCAFSLVIAIFLGFQIEPVFNYLLDTNIHLLSEITKLNVLIAIGFMILVALLSGLVPALKISRFDPIDVLKGKFKMKEKNVYSKIMIGFQYLIIICLITSAFFISKQTHFLMNYELGFEKDNMIELQSSISAKKQWLFKDVLENIPGVKEVSISRGTPTDGGNNNCFTYEDKEVSFQHFKIDTNFFKIHQIPVQKTGIAYAKNVCWLNETAYKVLDLPKDAEVFDLQGTKFPIYGIVKDFHFRDLKNKLGPAYFTILPRDHYAWSLTLKLNGNTTLACLEKIKEAHEKFSDGVPLEISFLDQTVQSWYEKEKKTGKIVKYFAILTVIISVMGLFAMSLYYVQQKQKEIGIRKTNGAKTHEIMRMLNQDFSIWVFIAFVFACPISYYSMNKWLESFAYKTELSWWVFALAGIIAMGIALITVSWQSWRAAKRNPVESLRYE